MHHLPLQYEKKSRAETRDLALFTFLAGVANARSARPQPLHQDHAVRIMRRSRR